MKSRESSRDNQHFAQNTASGMRNILLIWSVILLIPGGGSAQTTPAQVTPTPATPTQVAAPTASLVTTNATGEQAEKLPHVQVSLSLGGAPELPSRDPKVNELTLGQHTYSGIVVQVIRANNPLQLLNPAAPSRYGSGWDNLERFPATSSGPMLKLFSFTF